MGFMSATDNGIDVEEDSEAPHEQHSQAPPVVVVMGVSGTGKTTIGPLVAEALGLPYAEGDDFHPAANVAKMSVGVPLDDEDRGPGSTPSGSGRTAGPGSAAW